MLGIFGFLTSFAQNADHKKARSLGFQFSFIDHQTATDLRTKAFANVINEEQWYRINRKAPALTLTYMKGLSNTVDFAARLTGSFLAYPLRGVANNGQELFLSELDANVHVKLLPDHFLVVPYFSAGAGVLTTNKSLAAYIPLGVGLQINLWNDAFVHLQTIHRSPVTSKATHSLFHSIGVSVPIEKK